jgi:tetratricopeptide (TPR) repeat protein
MLSKFSKLLIIGLILSIGTTFAQTGREDGSKHGHGEDSIRCMKNLSLENEYYKQKNFTDALVYWQQVFDECPKATSNIYSHGETMYKALLKKEKDPVKKEEYYNKLMSIYDQRIKYFGNSKRYPASYIMGKKGMAMLKYKGDDKEVVNAASELINKAITERGVKTQAIVIITFMKNTVDRYRDGDLDEMAVVDNYNTASKILTMKIEAAKGDKQIEYEGYKKMIDKLFASSGAASCKNIEKIFGPQLADHSEDLDWLKRINRLLVRSNCDESQIFFNTSELLYKIEPSASSAYGLFKMNLETKNIEKAKQYLKEAIEMEEDNDIKAKYYTKLALLSLSEKKYQEVKSISLKAIALKPDCGTAYILIGKAYAASANTYGKNAFEHSTVYWVAVDKFIRAKKADPSKAEEANNLISIYSAHFPNKEEIFFQKEVAIGASYKIGGWINETTKVRERK